MTGTPPWSSTAEAIVLPMKPAPPVMSTFMSASTRPPADPVAFRKRAILRDFGYRPEVSLS
jgi:hypothetical protein